MNSKELDEFMEYYGYIASTTFAVPIDRDKLKDLVLTLKRCLAKKKSKRSKKHLG